MKAADTSKTELRRKTLSTKLQIVKYSYRDIISSLQGYQGDLSWLHIAHYEEDEDIGRFFSSGAVTSDMLKTWYRSSTRHIEEVLKR